MIQRITRLLVLLQVVLAASFAAGAYRVLHLGPFSAALLGAAIVLLVRMAIIGNNFMLAWRYRSPTPPEHRIGYPQACTLFLGEYVSSMLASSVTMPFCRFSHRPARSPNVLPVLLIHGYGCNSGYWYFMSRALRKAGITHDALDLEPVMGDIDDYVPLVHERIEQMCRDRGVKQVIIVAHSMGGLVTRAYFRRHGVDRIAKAITLGTPHHGTALAHYGIGTNSAQMRWTLVEQEEPASEWLRELAATEDARLRGRIVSIYSHHDNIIAPQTSSILPGALNVAFHGIGHVALALHPAIQERVIAEVCSVTATSA